MSFGRFSPTLEAPEPIAPRVHAREITLRFSGDLVVKGRVRATDGFTRCVRKTLVEIKRNGKRVALVRTPSEGRFRTRLPDRLGIYTATAMPFDLPNDSCSVASARRAYPTW